MPSILNPEGAPPRAPWQSVAMGDLNVPTGWKPRDRDLAWGNRRAWLLGVILLASVLRLPALGAVPPGLFRDEASTGYDAFCLATTGRDQYGKRWPLFSRSFGDFNESAYRFLAVPFVSALGLTASSVRLPAALVGVLSVLALYLLVQLWLGTRVALVAALMLAVSPWHVALSRIAFRAILLPPLFCLALWALHRALDGQRRALPSAAALFAAGLYTYSAARVFVPLFLLLAIILYRRELWAMRRHTALGALIFVAGLIPLVLFWTSDQGMARAQAAALTDDPLRFLANFGSYFSPDFLFLQGDPNIRASPSGWGALHLFEAATVPLGLALILRTNGRARGTVLIWLLLYPIPAAYTAPAHALRAIVGAPIFALLSGRGLVGLAELARGARWRVILGGLIAATALGGSTALFAAHYFRDYPAESYDAWQAEMKPIVEAIARRDDDCIHLSDRFLRGHIYFLFYGAVPCASYQEHPRDVRPLTERPVPYNLGRIRFGPTEEPPPPGACLYAVAPSELSLLRGFDRKLRTVEILRDARGRAVAHLVEVWGP